MSSRIRIGLIVAFMGILALGSPMGAFASTDTYEYYDKGRAYSAMLGSMQLDGSTVVISTSAYYLPSKDYGRERIRLWSKLDQVKRTYPPSLGYLSWCQQMNLRFYSDDSRAHDLMIRATDPQTMAGPSAWIENVIYDIFCYKGIPTLTIQAFVNSMFTEGTEVVSETGPGFDTTVRFYRPDDSRVDLPNSIPYSEADLQVGSTYSGASAVFEFTLPSIDTWFLCWPQGQVKYGILYTGGSGSIWYVWSGATGVHHYVNTH
ncbi:MAG: hypothetical protein H5U02_14590 [Clostridia bacterium]|nr:hypothetical protein [Clostridia bacterium]